MDHSFPRHAALTQVVVGELGIKLALVVHKCNIEVESIGVVGRKNLTLNNGAMVWGGIVVLEP